MSWLAGSRDGQEGPGGWGDGTGVPATLPWAGRAPRRGHGPGPSRRLASTGSTNLTVPAVAQPAVAEILPDPLDRVELRAARRRVDQAQVRRHGQALADAPAGPVEDERGVRPG